MHSLSDNELQPEGAKHVADAIATNTTLKELKYALLHPQPCRQQPMTRILLTPSARSLQDNLLNNAAKKQLKKAARVRIKLHL